jgi:hypothetical protein
LVLERIAGGCPETNARAEKMTDPQVMGSQDKAWSPHIEAFVTSCWREGYP